MIVICDNCQNVLNKENEDKFVYCQHNNEVYCSYDCTVDALMEYTNCKEISYQEVKELRKVKL